VSGTVRPTASAEVTTPAADCGTPASERTNVVIVLTDQQRWDTLGVAGCPLDVTPYLDRLARAGTYALDAVTPQPVCAPARAALQTGRWPTLTGVHRNDIPLLSDTPGESGVVYLRHPVACVPCQAWSRAAHYRAHQSPAPREARPRPPPSVLIQAEHDRVLTTLNNGQSPTSPSSRPEPRLWTRAACF